MALVEIPQALAADIVLDDFIADEPYAPTAPVDRGPSPEMDGLIQDVGLRRLGRNTDRRGHLTELFSTISGRRDAVVHLYQVMAQPGSVRAWVYHRHQRDRLSFTQGSFQVVLYDLRPESPTFRRFNLIRAGSADPVQVEIPPLVVHGVYNAGEDAASFVNMPTAVWRVDAPDKYRIPYPDPRLPFAFGR